MSVTKLVVVVPSDEDARDSLYEQFNKKLTPKQEMHAAYLHFCVGLSQQILPHIFLCNQGRTNESCRKIGSAAGACEPGYKDRDDE